MLNRKFIAQAAFSTLMVATLALTGCGSTPTMVDDPYADTGYTDPSGGYTDPSTGNGYTDPSTGGYNNGGYNGGTSNGAGTGYNVGGELSASVVKVKNGSFLGIGKCVVTVEVMNPSTQSLSGSLTVTFTNGGKPTKHIETKDVTVGPGESQTFEFTDKKWSTDNATAEIITNPSSASAGGAYGTQPAYGSQPSYGSTTGGASYGQTY